MCSLFQVVRAVRCYRTSPSGSPAFTPRAFRRWIRYCVLAHPKQQKRHSTSPMILTTALRPIGHPHTGQPASPASPAFVRDAVFESASTRYTSQLARSSGGGASIAGLASKKPTGFSEKPI